jgi:acetyl esterase/lipase
MSFDDLKPQPPRDASNSRVPGPANEYGEQALARSREAAAQCRTVTDIAFGPDYYQKLDIYLPDNETNRDLPVLLYFHGGAWQHGYKEWNGFVAPVIVDLPAIFISASYRLVPEVNFPAPLDDAMTALDWVWRNIAEYGGDPNRIFAGGWSVGGTLASLVTLRRDLYAQFGLPDGLIKACFAASGGYRYKHDVLAPGNSGKTYGDLMYEHPEDELLAEPLHYVKGNRTPFYISWAANDFAHVMQSSQDMANALKAEGSAVESDQFDGVDHYKFNLAHGDPDDKWIKTVCSWMTQLPDS